MAMKVLPIIKKSIAMNNILKHSIYIIVLLLVSLQSSAQLDSIVKQCAVLLPSPFISDGQQYRALLSSNEETAEFKSTFYGGSTYRIVVCGTIPQEQLIFSLYDAQRNLLFSSRDYQRTPYWDFKFDYTAECFIEAQFDETTTSSGMIMLLIGFKQ